MLINTIVLSPSQLWVYLPELWLSITVSILLVYVVLPKTKELGQWTQIKNMDDLIIPALIITAILTWNLLILCINNDMNFISYNGWIKLDSITCLIKFISILGAIGVISISKEYYAQEHIKLIGHNLLILLALLGIILLVSSNDLITIYLAMELQSLSFYTLATLKRDDESSTEAGLKYFVLGGLSSGIYLFGAGLIYGWTGFTNLDSLHLFIFGSSPELSMNGLILGMIFIGIALLFKIAAAPFHMWVPDVYQGSPTPITAFFATVPKIAILGILIRLYFDTFFAFMNLWLPLLFFCSIASMIIGSLGALNQSLLKRLLAYSAISHIGYILIAFLTGTHTSLQALLIYLVIYMLMSLQSFTILLSLRKKLNGKGVSYLIELVGLSRSHPLLAFTFAISLFSLAGIPPLAGFFSKWLVFSSAIQSNYYLLAIIGVVTSVLASLYYIRIIINMYARYSDQWKFIFSSQSVQRLNQPGAFFNLNVLFDTLNPWILPDKSKSLILGWTTFFILFLLFFPTPLLLLTHQVALLTYF